MTKTYIDNYNSLRAQGKSDAIANRDAVLAEKTRSFRMYMSTWEGSNATLSIPKGPGISFVLMDKEMLDSDGFPIEEAAEIVADFDEEIGLKKAIDVYTYKHIGDFRGQMLIVERLDRGHFRAWLAGTRH